MALVKVKNFDDVTRDLFSYMMVVSYWKAALCGRLFYAVFEILEHAGFTDSTCCDSNADISIQVHSGASMRITCITVTNHRSSKCCLLPNFFIFHDLA